MKNFFRIPETIIGSGCAGSAKRRKLEMKVMTILGTRPEIIRLSRVMAVLDQVVDHKLVHTGQNYDYELNDVFLKS